MPLQPGDPAPDFRLPGTDDACEVGAGRHHWIYEVDEAIAEGWRSPASAWST